MAGAADRIRRLVDERGEVANRDAAFALGVSPATAHRVLRSLVVAGVLERHGRGPAARYRLRRVRRRFSTRGLEEDRAWRRVADEIARIRPLGEEELRSLQYAATEVLNNAAEHARGRRVEIDVEFAPRATTVVTVCEDFGFPSAEDAIVGLEKGKLTSDPARHSGEGLFFSSKAVSRFRLESQKTAWVVDNVVEDSAIAPSIVSRGTSVRLEVVRGRTPRLGKVFAAYADPESLKFVRTRATVKLVAHGKSLVSRSEARRLTEGLTKFTHVTLDFSGVETVGQGFCDEVFRVFARNHPGVALEAVGMNHSVAFMVARARNGARSGAPPR